jgi:release factor glutamine methyltransferase
LTLKTYKSYFIKQLSPIVDAIEAESFFFIVLEKLHNLKRIDLALQPKLELSEEKQVEWNSILAELITQKPIQYILGETEFYGLPFIVNENTLIPRSETEELISWIVDDIKAEGLKDLKILDIGTGSGCISISLAKNIEQATVFAMDVSSDALTVARKNSEVNKVNVTFIEQNILLTEDLNQEFDILVSNPPYVRNLEKLEIKSNVLDYEPHLALFVEDDDALLFYRKIAHLAKKNLSKKGLLYFEINQYLGKETVTLLEDMYFKNIELKKDIYGNDRMIKCSI